MGNQIDIEAPAAFYLGKLLEKQDGEARPLLLEAGDLTTHAVCVGMTGSGKTGLGIGLLEEALLDGIPAIVIDPKGDLSNLLLTFPELSPADFAPWVNPDEAARQGLALEAFAAQVADLWRNGLAGDGQGPERIQRLRNAADFRVYTPGSEAGLPISVVQTLAPPAHLDWETQAEALRERIESAVSALLALVGIEADPVRSREHILLTNILQDAWQKGEALDLAGLIRSVQKPPLTQLGVFDLDTFFPPKDRLALAMSLNTIIAAPAFAAWLKGDALDPASLFWAPDGKPRLSIFSIAHLDDSQRTFFVTLLLEQVVGWMRAQPGAAELRALIYFDELFGYLPPYPKNPPTKRPLLTLLKQARAVGLGLVLATQNPVDLDYKALSNAGVWLVGRLQTEQDKGRLLDGLMAVQTAGAPLDRGRLETIISGLPKRTFVMNNVHDPGLKVFKTRWAMSYLRGPLTREQIRVLMEPVKAREAQAAQPAAAAGACSQCGSPLDAGARFCNQCGARVTTLPAPAAREEQGFKESLRQAAAPPPPTVEGYSAEPPMLAGGITQYYLPLPAGPGQGQVFYDPVVLAKASLTVLDQRRGVDHREEYLLALDPPDEGQAARWEAAERLSYDSDGLAAGPAASALFGPVPESMNASPKLTALKKQLSDHLYVNSRVTLLYCEELDLYSKVSEDPRDFEVRLQKAVDAQRDAEVEKLKQRFQTQIDRVEERLRQEKHDLSDAEAEYAARKREEALSAAESVLGFLTRRRSSTVLTKASTKRRLTEKSKLGLEESQEQIETYEKEIEKLQKDLQVAIEDLHDQWAAKAQKITEYQVRPRRSDIQIMFLGLGWRPMRA